MKAWQYDEVICGHNLDSVEEFMQAARDDEAIDADQILVDVKAYRLPVRQFGTEEWDSDQMYPMPIGDRPGRGYVKVLVGEAADPEPHDSETGDDRGRRL